MLLVLDYISFPPKRLFTYGLLGAMSQQTFVTTAVRT
jgi:hypothetical protein